MYIFGAHQCAIPIKIHNFLHCNFNEKIMNCKKIYNDCQNKFNIFNKYRQVMGLNILIFNSFKTNKSLLSTKISDLNSIIEKYEKQTFLF